MLCKINMLYSNLLLTAFCAVIIRQSDARNSFIFIAPNAFRPGRDYIIHGHLLETPPSSVTVSASLKSTSRPSATLAQTDVILSDTQDVQIVLKIPFNIEVNGGVMIHVDGSWGLTFNEKKFVKLVKKVTSVYLQTDKAIYKTGQTVNFRVFGVTPDLRVVFDKLKVELYDPKGNKINQWDVSNFDLTNMGGVYVQHQVMSEAPVLGTWKLKAKLLSYGDKFEEKTFEVDEYVLPKFEAELDLPLFGRTEETDFTGNVKAKYTFGKPVKGIVDLRIKPKRERFEFKNGQRVSTSNTIEMKFPINGKASFTVSMARLKEVETFLDRSSLKFEVNVTETLTKFKQSDAQELTFYKQPIKLEFPKSLPETFKPGMTYDAVVKVSQQDGTPPDSANGDLKVTVTEYENRAWRDRPVPMPRSFQSSSLGSNFIRRPWHFPRPRPPKPRRNRLPPTFHTIPSDGIPMQRSFQSSSLGSNFIHRPWHFPSPRPPKPRRNRLPPTFHTIPSDGIVEFPLDIGSKITKVEVEAEYNGVKVTKSMKKRHSPSNNYLQLRLKTQAPKAGQISKFQLKTTEPVPEVIYQVFARGVLTSAGTVPISSRRQQWTLMLAPHMAPKARVVALYVRSNGEVVADGLTINVEGVFENKVSLSFNKTEAAPSDKIRLDVTADPGSTLNILGIDKSVLLLGSGNDVDSSQVLQDLNGYSLKGNRKSTRHHGCDWFCRRWPMPSGGDDVKDVFDDAGVVVLTDAQVYEHREAPRLPRMPPMRPMSRRRFGGWNAALSFGGHPITMLDSNIGTQQHGNRSPNVVAIMGRAMLPPKELAPIQKTRKLFPETWLWSTKTIQSGGMISIEETVPDTITSWVATAFAIHPDTGLGITENSAQLAVSLPFFASVNLPYSVIRGEKVILQVNIHNYSPQALFTYVTLDKSDDFENILINGVFQTTTSMHQKRTLTVGANEVAAFYFPIIPRTIGLIDLSVKAQTATVADGVKKKLLVEAEGSPREYNIPFVVDLKQTGTLMKTVNVEYPLRTVSGSERVKVTVIGDLMGPSINGLDKLLKMPTGCGEQNMLKFAPNIFIIKYLEATKSLDEQVMNKAKEFMESGLQRELTYRHSDGSFSAFGSRDPSGSTWLTAFVLKSFVQAKPYIFVDDAVVNKAIDWLIKHQDMDGTFNEPGRVIHKAMQGGSTSGKVSLTAYVLISLLEARAVEGVAGRISDAQQKSQIYLENQIPTLTDVYELAIVAYALQLANSPQANTVWQKLDAKAKVEAGTKYWQKVQKDTANLKPYQKRNGVAIDIELSSYALLLLANKNDRINGVQVLKWITEQRNPKGGFSSTQDTVLALQGLAEMAAMIYTDAYDLTVNVVGTAFSDTLTFQKINARVLQTREMPSDVGAVTMSVTGSGLALVQIEVSYNIDDDDQKQSFQLTVSLPRETMNDFDVMVCARWMEEGSSSMAVMEIGSPSGFIHDIVSIFSEPTHKRVDLDTRKVVMYFDEIGTQDTCSTMTLHRVGLVAGAQPVPVKVYDYYEPTKQVTEFYVPKAVSSSEVCDICGTECDFCVPQ